MIPNSFKHFSNRECKFFPCHDDENQNCMFCYCPLYPFKDCGGKYVILMNGWKDCSRCRLPHVKGGYEYVTEKLQQLHKEGRV
jgi:hypothetical protein